MEYKGAKLSVDMVDGGEFFGVAAVYGNVDLGGDVIRRGALTKTIAENGGKVQLLDSHRTPIGLAEITDGPKGLNTHGILNLEKQIARDVYSDLKFYHSHGKPYGLSIGYETIHAKHERDTRIVTELRLHEISTTWSPMNPEARIDAVKSADDERVIRAVITMLRTFRLGARI